MTSEIAGTNDDSIKIPFDEWQRMQREKAEATPQAKLGSDDIGDLSETKVCYGKPGGKFYNTTFSEICLRDLDWLVGQTWVREPLRSKLVSYLSKTPIQRALEKELNQ